MARREPSGIFQHERMFGQGCKGEGTMKSRMLPIVCSAVALSSLAWFQPRSETSPRTPERIQKEVRQELILLPFLGVFDNLAYQLNGPNVTLLGQVTRPTLKSDAEDAVKRIEGIKRVNNQIEILPLSPFDNTLRLRLFRAVYDYAPLEKYALGVNKPIRIIVKNGRAALEGVVDCEADKNIAGIRANGVPDVSFVANNLQISK
jgi:hyperosmotically inducible protein